ncbi:MAG: hypothetical protein Q3M30_10530 [Candidatus Electrothrix sp. Rat3]|nr:hypothetical protein [Candidatus Electrothrix rattekaaiensis]
MKTTYIQVFQRLTIVLALSLTLGCTPVKALSDCDPDHPQNENSAALPDFGFSPGRTCNEAASEAAPSDNSEHDDALLKDIEEPLDSPSSDLVATPAALEKKQPTS